LKRRLSLNDRILDDVRPAIFEALSARREYKISNVDRTIGARLAGEIAREHGDKGLPAGTIELSFRGSAGQSFGAFCISGMTLNLNGEANDYVGKGMAGGEINVSPYNDTKFNAHNVLAGNAILYGATGGSLSIAGSVGERFCVRNSGAKAVVEGIGDHGCEYMTNGEVAILGPTGINFGAGMTGGVAYVYAPDDTFLLRCNGAYVEPQRIGSRVDAESLRDLIEHHYTRTGSATAQTMLAEWQSVLTRFWIVRPRTADKLRVHSSGAVNPIVNQIRA
jgi:glutamate synthase domain-containing protein 3